MTRPATQRLVDVAAILALVSLALIVWSVLDPTPLAVVLAMSAGQLVGTASLALLMVAIVRELRRARLLSRSRDR